MEAPKRAAALDEVDKTAEESAQTGKAGRLISLESIFFPF